jgi:hypothetical protein
MAFDLLYSRIRRREADSRLGWHIQDPPWSILLRQKLKIVNQPPANRQDATGFGPRPNRMFIQQLPRSTSSHDQGWDRAFHLR